MSIVHSVDNYQYFTKNNFPRDSRYSTFRNFIVLFCSFIAPFPYLQFSYFYFLLLLISSSFFTLNFKFYFILHFSLRLVIRAIFVFYVIYCFLSVLINQKYHSIQLFGESTWSMIDRLSYYYNLVEIHRSQSTMTQYLHNIL